jgi:hypothetical protein
MPAMQKKKNAVWRLLFCNSNFAERELNKEIVKFNKENFLRGKFKILTIPNPLNASSVPN